MRVGGESARFHGIVNGESLRNVFCCLLCIFYCRTTPILKTLGQFENLMTTRENIRLIARTPLLSKLRFHPHLYNMVPTSWKYHRITGTQYCVITNVHDLLGQFSYMLYKNLNQKCKYKRTTLKAENGLVQLISVGYSIRLKWVNDTRFRLHLLWTDPRASILSRTSFNT